MAEGILRAIDRLGEGPLRRILLTHGHSDHTGAIAPILRRRPVPVYAHEREIPYMTGQLPYPRRRRPAAGLAPGVAEPLAEEGQRRPGPRGRAPALPDPGHSPGHVAYYHERDRVLLAGDLFTSRQGRLGRPMAIFTADMEEAVRSGAIVATLQPERLEICHGGPVLNPAAQISQYPRLPGSARCCRRAQRPGTGGPAQSRTICWHWQDWHGQEVTLDAAHPRRGRRARPRQGTAAEPGAGRLAR